MKLKDKVAGITGSVRGMGWQMAEAYAQEGAALIICDISQSDVDQAVERLGLPPDRVLGVKADVSVEKEVIFMFQRIREKFGRLDIWVNNAGFSWPRKAPLDLEGYTEYEIADTPFEVWLKVLNTNLNGAFLCSREALKIMRRQKSGSLINISSKQVKRGDPLRGPYCASRFGVEGLTQVIAVENASYNIRANALDPGNIVGTEWQLKKASNKGKRMLSPDVVRPLAVYLASDEAKGITGQSIDAAEWNIQHGIEVKYVIG